MSTFHVKWLTGLITKDKAAMKEDLINAENVFIRLKEILDEKIELAEKDRGDESNYGQASWPYLMADTNGQVKAYKKVLKYLKHLDD